MAWTIKEVSKQTGISPHTLRFWAKVGLFETFIDRDENGVKYFDKRGVELIAWIACLRDTGMSLKDTKKYMKLIAQGRKSANERKEMLLKQTAILKQQLTNIHQSIEKLEHKISIYDEMIATGKDLLHSKIH
ncbi:MerR family transcriptional regulator [Helicobacter sp. MIT 05-5294]|uniref:MerR family transcriptional regulator n=1 Tax=Helicobacter sp. MIT 05-5294 TaxID=1548150 RepID=UPI0010FE5148|nr:MerR family transcriptional regulator [Helicobacter sp. MIT 05-5294]TLD86200.1 MerR family transcriptional regulator [Helicobacter sp. MIT 05-5294]